MIVTWFDITPIYAIFDHILHLLYMIDLWINEIELILDTY